MSQGTLDFQPASMHFDQCLGDCESQPPAVLRNIRVCLSSREWLHNTLQVFVRNTGAGVGYGQLHALIDMTCGHPNAPAVCGVLQCVGQEVEQNLLYRLMICDERYLGGFLCNFDSDIALQGNVLDDRVTFLERFKCIEIFEGQARRFRFNG